MTFKRINVLVVSTSAICGGVFWLSFWTCAGGAWVLGAGKPPEPEVQS